MAASFGTVDGDLLLHNQTDSKNTTGYYEGTTGHYEGTTRFYEGMFTVLSSNIQNNYNCAIMPN